MLSAILLLFKRIIELQKRILNYFNIGLCITYINNFLFLQLNFYYNFVFHEHRQPD